MYRTVYMELIQFFFRTNMEPQERSAKRPLSVLTEEATVIHRFESRSIDAIAVCDYPSGFCSEFCLLVATGTDLCVYNFFENEKDASGRNVSPRKLKLDRTYSVDKAIAHVSLWPLSESRLHPFPIRIAVAFHDFSISILSDCLSLSHQGSMHSVLACYNTSLISKL